MRAACLALTLWVLAPAAVAADWQLRPFIGFTFGGETTFVDPEKAIGTKNAVIGVSGGWLGEIFGLEGDFGRAPGFFQTDAPPGTSGLADPEVLTSAVGLNWDVRRLSTMRGEGETVGNSLGREQLSFWRATMSVALRY
jgi:hypothetical protein